MEEKSFLHSSWFKFLIFTLIIVSFTLTSMVFLDMLGKDYNMVSPLGKEYKTSEEVDFKYSNLYGYLTEILDYKSEEYIRDQANISEQEIINRQEQIYSDFRHRGYEGQYSELVNKDKRYDENLSEEENLERFRKIYKEELAEIPKDLVNERVKRYESVMEKLEDEYGLNSSNKKQNIYFYATDGSYEFKNGNLTEENMDEYISNSNDWMQFDHKYKVLMAMDNDYFKAEESRWLETRDVFYNDFKKLAIFSIVTISLFIFLLILTGRNYFGDKNIHMNFIDSLYTDVNICMCIFLIVIWIAIVDMTDTLTMSLPIMDGITAFIGALGLILVLSLMRHLKNKSFLRHSLMGRIFMAIINFFKGIYDSGRPGYKFIFLMIAYPLALAVTIFIFPLTMAICIWQGLKRVRDFEAIKDGIKKVKEGDLDYTIEVKSKGEMKDLADNINSISDGLKNAVDNELKSERLKSELITNVSHDIRTPLTSIITYVDLLKRETDMEKQREYIAVLETKAERLKTLTDDLFEASKASSGNIPVDIKEVDLVALVNQGLGELDDKIKSNDLNFIITDVDELNVLADGELLWRSLDNIFNNIFKYAQKDSRVYIDLIDLGDRARIIVKNISEYELNISEEELMERFTRGDESRTSEGSGLGLSIVKSLIELQGGNFKIEIDGDLFKSIIELPRA